jgi:parallel beta-helix repeat protein
MRRRTLFALTAMALLAPRAEAIIRCVKPVPTNGCYPSIQAAVDESIPGDIIKLAAGVYFENVDIPGGKDGLQILGAGKLKTIVDPDHPLSGNAFTVDSNRVKIRNLGIRNGRAHGIFLDGVSDVVIQGVRIVGLRGAASSGIIGLGTSRLQLLQNEIRAVRNSGIEVGGEDAVVKGNTVAQTPQGIFVLGAGARVTANKVSGVHGGIAVEGVSGGGVTVSGNTVQLAIDDGLSVSGQSFIVQRNKLIHGAEAQISCPSCSRGVVSANTSSGSRDFGFSIWGEGPGLVVEKNRVSHANGPAFLFSGLEATRNAATDIGVFGNNDGPDCFKVTDGESTRLTANTATRCAASGFRVVNGNSAILSRNTATGAGIDGFTVAGTFSQDNTLTGNKAVSSNAAGFAVVDAVGTSLTGNTGTKNRYGFCDDGTSTTVGQNSFGVPPTSNVCDVVQ